MTLHLQEISRAVKLRAHAVVLLDQAGWHGSKELKVPDNITLFPLPPRLRGSRSPLRDPRPGANLPAHHAPVVARSVAQALGPKHSVTRAFAKAAQTVDRVDLWYARLAMERLIFDEPEAAIDPNAAKSFRRIEQGARRDYGQKFWWRPGTPLPRRGPDLGAVAP